VKNVKKSGVRKVPLTEAVLNRKKEPSEKREHFFSGGGVFSLCLPAVFHVRRFFWRIGGTGEL